MDIVGGIFFGSSLLVPLTDDVREAASGHGAAPARVARRRSWARRVALVWHSRLILSTILTDRDVPKRYCDGARYGFLSGEAVDRRLTYQKIASQSEREMRRTGR